MPNQKMVNVTNVSMPSDECPAKLTKSLTEKTISTSDSLRALADMMDRRDRLNDAIKELRGRVAETYGVDPEELSVR